MEKGNSTSRCSDHKNNNAKNKNYLVGTNTIQNNSDIQETIAFKGSYSSNILFPILTTTSSQEQRHQKKTERDHDMFNNNPYVNEDISNNNAINNSEISASSNICDTKNNNCRSENILLRRCCNNTIIEISDSEPEDNDNANGVLYIEDPSIPFPPQEIPSYFARIIAPPTPFAEGSKLTPGESANRSSGFRFGLCDLNHNLQTINTRFQFCELADCEANDCQCQHESNINGSREKLEILPLPHLTATCTSLKLHTQDFSYPTFDEMGWGQPNVGKRVRQDSPTPNQQNENQPDHHSHSTGYSASESETDEEIRGHLIHKRSRDVSPVRSTPGLMDFAKVNTVPLNVNSSVNALSVCRVQVKQQSDDENVSYAESIEPISSLSSETCHSISVTSATSNTMLNAPQFFSSTRDRDVELGSSKQMMDDDEAQYLDNFPSDCFLGPHGNVIFPTPAPPTKIRSHVQVSRNSSPHHAATNLTTISEQQQQQQMYSRFCMATPLGCPPPPSAHPDKFLSHMKSEKDNMVVSGPVRGGEILLSSPSSAIGGALSNNDRHPASGTVENSRLTSLSSAVPKFKGPRVPTATKGGRTPPKSFNRNHGSPQYAYSLLRAAKNPKVNATTMGKNVHEPEEAEDSETDPDDEADPDEDGDGDGNGIYDNDNFTGLKGDEAVEDDASTSTDITLPNIVRKIVPPIRPSYFPNVPPYINFCLHDEKSETLPAEIRKHLKWRMSTITPIVIKKTVANSGFRLLKKTTEWGGQWGKHMKGAVFRSTLKEYQKLNHLPATFQLGRKDRLWKNIYRFILKYGKSQYGFLPRTYILPHDTKQLKHAWDSAESRERMWIIKPPAGARGTGIRVINKWNQVPKKRPVIVQQYISKPLLINDRKFDLRLYVLVTNFHPLRVYLYDDGLVRFAPVKYSHDAKRVSDRFMHLTNYSVNKNCELYTQNEDANACKGHKWTLKTLWRYMRTNGTDTEAVMKRIEDIVIKTLISAEDCITSSAFNMPCRYNGYELFGFDIILDETLKPWLLEVNISPSLHSSSPLDLAVKGPLVKEVFNIAGYHLPPSLSKNAKKNFVERLDKVLELEQPTFDKRIYCNVNTKEEKTKHHVFRAKYDDRSQYLTEILESLTPDDIRHLIAAEDELSQCNGFNRIFPTRSTHSYFAFFESPRYYNMLMDAWENKYDGDRAAAITLLQELCRRKHHLITVSTGPQPICENPNPVLEDTCENEEAEGDVEFLQSEADSNALLEPMFIPVVSVPITSRSQSMPYPDDPVLTSSSVTATGTATALSGGPIYTPFPGPIRMIRGMESASTTGSAEDSQIDVDNDEAIESSEEGFELRRQNYAFTSMTDGELSQYSQPQNGGSNVNYFSNTQTQQGSLAAVKMERCIVIQEGGHRTAVRTSHDQNQNHPPVHHGPASPGIISVVASPCQPSPQQLLIPVSAHSHLHAPAPVLVPGREELEFQYSPPPHSVTYHHVPLTNEGGLNSSIMNGNVNSNSNSNSNNSAHSSTTPVPVNEYNKIKGVCY